MTPTHSRHVISANAVGDMCVSKRVTERMAPCCPHSSCPHCGYDLRVQLTSRGARCPECGKSWPRSVFARGQRSVGDRVFFASATLPAVIAVLLGVAWMTWRANELLVPAVAAVGLMIVGVVFASSVGWNTAHDIRFRKRGLVALGYGAFALGMNGLTLILLGNIASLIATVAAE